MTSSSHERRTPGQFSRTAKDKSMACARRVRIARLARLHALHSSSVSPCAGRSYRRARRSSVNDSRTASFAQRAASFALHTEGFDRRPASFASRTARLDFRSAAHELCIAASASRTSRQTSLSDSFFLRPLGLRAEDRGVRLRVLSRRLAYRRPRCAEVHSPAADCDERVEDLGSSRPDLDVFGAFPRVARRDTRATTRGPRLSTPRRQAATCDSEDVRCAPRVDSLVSRAESRVSRATRRAPWRE